MELKKMAQGQERSLDVAASRLLFVMVESIHDACSRCEARQFCQFISCVETNSHLLVFQKKINIADAIHTRPVDRRLS